MVVTLSLVAARANAAPLDTPSTRAPDDALSTAPPAAASTAPPAPNEPRNGVALLVGVGPIYVTPRVGTWDVTGAQAYGGIGVVIFERVELSLQALGYVATGDGAVTSIGTQAAAKVWAVSKLWGEATLGLARMTGCGDTCSSREGTTLGGVIAFAPTGGGHSITFGASTLITDSSFGLHTFAVGYRYDVTLSP